MPHTMKRHVRQRPGSPGSRLALAAAIFAAVLASACARDSDPATNENAHSAPIPAVEVVAAREGTLPLSERLTGTVRALGEVAIVPEGEGVVVEVFVENGDRVRKGEPLVQVRTAGLAAQTAQARSMLQAARAELNQASANLRQLESQYERNRVLGAQGLVPADTVATLRAQTEAARANVARAKAQVSVAEGSVAERADIQGQTLIRAPIDGRVGQRNAEVGLRVGPQTALFVIGRLDEVCVEVPVTQEMIGRIREGQRAEIRTPRNDRVRAAPGDGKDSDDPILAHVSRISPFLSEGSLSAEVEIDVPNPRGTLVPGMFVSVDIFYGESSRATLVPASALYEDPATGARGVFVTSAVPVDTADRLNSETDDAADAGSRLTAHSPVVPLTFRPITLAAAGGQTAGIEGVKPGEWVVVVGQHLLAAQSDGKTPPRARLRIVTWERILELQRMERQDLLRQFMDKQRRLAMERPTSWRAPGMDARKSL